jgi:hypothetical protein
LTDRGEGREVAKVITTEQHRARVAFHGEFSQGGSLVHARRAELQHEPTRFDRERGAGGQPPEGFPEERQRRHRVRRPPRMDGQCRALVFHRGSLGRRHVGEQAGQCLAHSLDTRRHSRRAEHARLPALRAVVPEDDQAGHFG